MDRPGRDSSSCRSIVGGRCKPLGRHLIRCIAFFQPIQRDFLPFAQAQFAQGNADGDLVHPGCELAAAFESVQLVDHTQERLLCHVVQEGIKVSTVR